MAQPSAPNSIILEVKGLYLNPSTFGNNAPNGSLTKANNVVIDRPSVVATRRGFDNSFSTLVGASARSMFQYANIKLLHGSDNKLYSDPLGVSLYGTGVWQPYTGTYVQPIPFDVQIAESYGSRVRGIEANKNFYFITSNGTYRLDHIAGQPRLAGSPPGLSGTGVTTGSVGFLPPQTSVAYRVVFGFRDFNQQLVLGAPSSRIIVNNLSTTNSANVILTFQVPKEIQAAPTDYFFQVYRGHASPNLDTEPDDEMALAYEDLCTGSPLITITDITPDNLLGAALYTNQGQDGILQSNYRPPWALDICLFKQYAFYANTRTLQTANLTLVAAGSSNGSDALVAGDTVTFTSVEFGGPTFTLMAVDTPNNASLGWFQVSNTGNPGVDIQITASNVALVANSYAANSFLAAYYTSTPNELPGRLRFDELNLTVNAFTITVSRPSAWEQAMPITSINDTRPNRIYYSKFNQPEVVPVVNYIEVGSANSPIRRIVPLRDGVMVLKDDGVFRISNAAPPFTITPIDYNVRILADNTAAELDNKVYFLSDQGVVALSDSDAQIMSFVLDKTIIENTSPTLYPNLRAVAWGLAYQSDRKYILFMPITGGVPNINTPADQQYVYNHLTQVWSRWELVGTCGLVYRLDGRMYLGSQKGSAPTVNDSYVYQERKTFTSIDYADNEYSTNNTTVGNTDIIVIDNPQMPFGVEVLPGWTVTQETTGSNARVLVVSVGPTQTTLKLSKVQQWTASPVILFVPIESEVETIQLDCDNPGMNKQFSEIVYMFTEQSFTQVSAKLSSNTAGIPSSDILLPTIRGGWGIDPWGITPWGGSPSGQGKIRRYVPQPIQRAGWIYVNLSNAECFTSFGWSGCELFFKNTSSRQK
jgi:hypothetical protein